MIYKFAVRMKCTRKEVRIGLQKLLWKRCIHSSIKMDITSWSRSLFSKINLLNIYSLIKLGTQWIRRRKAKATRCHCQCPASSSCLTDEAPVLAHRFEVPCSSAVLDSKHHQCCIARTSVATLGCSQSCKVITCATATSLDFWRTSYTLENRWDSKIKHKRKIILKAISC